MTGVFRFNIDISCITTIPANRYLYKQNKHNTVFVFRIPDEPKLETCTSPWNHIVLNYRKHTMERFLFVRTYVPAKISHTTGALRATRAARVVRSGTVCDPVQTAAALAPRLQACSTTSAIAVAAVLRCQRRRRCSAVLLSLNSTTSKMKMAAALQC